MTLTAKILTSPGLLKTENRAKPPEAVNALTYILLAAGAVLLSSCSVIEKASLHNFSSGYYTMLSDSIKKQKVYLDVTDEYIAGYPVTNNNLNDQPVFTVSATSQGGQETLTGKFIKKSLDIDLTSVVFKYRFHDADLPGELTTDFNAALYAGWRKDYYLIHSKTNLLNNRSSEIINRGYDFGVFAGLGSTLVSPFTTRNSFAYEYNGMIIQYGISGFIESKVASFGIAGGFDYLVSGERKLWIYNKKPWIGLIIGIALN